MSAASLRRACESFLRACATGDAHAEVIRQLSAFAQAYPGSFVTSWNTRTGAVVPQNGDYTAAQVGAVPTTAVGAADGVAPLNGAAQISDGTHGARGGGTLHAEATTVAAGFMSAADKAKLDGLGASGTAWLYGLGLTASITVADGVTAAVLTGAVENVNTTMGVGSVQPMGGMPLIGTGTLTLGENARLTNNGSNGADNSLTAGAGAPGGQLGTNGAGTGGIGNGGQGGSAGGGFAASGTTTSPALGGAGGNGGNSSIGEIGSAGGAAARPVSASIGTTSFILDRVFIVRPDSGSNVTWQRMGSGAGGGGGRGLGASSSPGSGGAGGGGPALIRYPRIVLAAGAKIQVNGGRGGNSSLLGAGAGGGGGGGDLTVVCDELEMADDFADHFEAAGGAGGVASNGGVSGTAGSSGTIRIYVAGVLVYSLN